MEYKGSKEVLEVYLEGIVLSAGLIIAIGAQNAYVLKQGIQNNHIFWVATICFLCDFALMSIGILGVGNLVAKSEVFQLILATLGALYILMFAYQSFRAMWADTVMEMDQVQSKGSLKAVVLGALAITLLNPHVYLDTVVIIGSIAGTLEDHHKIAFLLGTLTASCLWFYSLGFGARLLAPIFKKPLTWRILNFLIGCMMLFIGYQLLLFIITMVMK